MSGQVVELRPGVRLVDTITGTVLPDVPAVRPVRVQLRPQARLDVEQARAFLMGLDQSVSGADLPRAMYLLGLLEGHAQSLLDVLDTIAEA